MYSVHHQTLPFLVEKQVWLAKLVSQARLVSFPEPQYGAHTLLSIWEQDYSQTYSTQKREGSSELHIQATSCHTVWCVPITLQYLVTLHIIGASLSEPHTSVTALRTRVCMLVRLDRPLTVNFK